MTKFADQLFQDLMAEHGDALTAGPAAQAAAPTRRRITRPAWAGVGTVAAAGAAALGFTVFGGTASAYAVTDNHNGSYTVKVDNPSGIAGANSKLAALRSRVAVVQAKAGCPSIDTFAAPGGGGGEVEVQVGIGGDPSKITVSASGLPADETALVVYSFEGGKSSAGMAPVKGKVPTCVSLPAAPPPGAVVGDDHGAKVQTDTGSGAEPGLSQQNK